MLGQDFVLFRDAQGVARCLSDICAHRGASLAGGKVKGDTVECPYHGWRYRGDTGACTRIPSIGINGKIPARAKVDSYPTVEKYGFVFAFLGDLPEAERPPIIDVPEWDKPGWRFTYNPYVLECNYERGIENALDPAHTEFVHPVMGFQGERDDYFIEDFVIVETPWGAGHKGRSVETPMPAGSAKREVGGEKFKTESLTGHFGPSTSYTYIHFSPTAGTHQYGFSTPIDHTRTRRFFMQARCFALDPAGDERMQNRTWQVINQDRAVIEKIRPWVAPASTTEEVIVPADKIIMRYREFLKVWEGKGWRIDLAALAAAGPNKAFAIPSPGRRTDKGWVLDPVPTVTPQALAQAAAE